MEQRCPHGFIRSQVRCEECGGREPLYGASSHLRRARERAAVGKRHTIESRRVAGSKIKPPASYRRAAERERKTG